MGGVTYVITHTLRARARAHVQLFFIMQNAKSKTCARASAVAAVAGPHVNTFTYYCKMRARLASRTTSMTVTTATTTMAAAGCVYCYELLL